MKKIILLFMLVMGMSLVGCKTHYRVSLADVVNAVNSSSHSSKASCKKIVEASWKGEYQTVKSLLQQGVSPNCVYAEKSALLAAARFGRQWRYDQNIDTVKILVEHGADIHYKYNSRGKIMTPAYIAAAMGHTKTATYLVSKGGSLKEAQEGHREYAAHQAGSMAALGLMTQAANAFAKSMTSGDAHSSNTSNSGSSVYKCKFHCEGQFGAKRGGDKTASVTAGSMMNAEQHVKEQYKDVCDMYPFYKSGRGATVGTVFCEKVY